RPYRRGALRRRTGRRLPRRSPADRGGLQAGPAEADALGLGRPPRPRLGVDQVDLVRVHLPARAARAARVERVVALEGAGHTDPLAGRELVRAVPRLLPV